jgi:hypothetical protein
MNAGGSNTVTKSITISSSAQSPSLTALTVFPQFVIGGGYTTKFALVNSGSTSFTGSLVLTSSNGSSLDARLTSSDGTTAIGASVSLQIAAGGSAFITASPINANDPISVGWASVGGSGGSVSGLLTFNLSSSDGKLLTTVSVLPLPLLQAATVPVDDDVAQNRMTGFAVANPGTVAITVDLVAISADGNTAVSLDPIVLAPGNQISKFFEQDVKMPSAFLGTVTLKSEAGGLFSVVALSQSSGVSGPLFTAVPVIPATSPNKPTSNPFTNSILYPTAVSSIDYPSTYLSNAVGLINDTDPYCRVQQQYVPVPQNFIGSFPFPTVSSTLSPLPERIQRGVEFKDFYGCCMSKPSGNQICTGASGDMHSAVHYGIQRAVALGSDHVNVVENAQIIDATASPLQFDLAQMQIPFSELQFIGNEARAAGIKVRVLLQVPPSDQKGNPLPSTPTATWFSDLLDAYTQYLVSVATVAQQNGFDGMTLNWFELYFNWSLNPQSYQSTFAAKMQDALRQVRAVFSGKVFLFDYLPGDLTGFSSLLQSTDGVYVEDDGAILSAAQNQNPTFDIVKTAYKGRMDKRKSRFGNTPLIYRSFAQSHRNFLYTGWIEDAGCTPGNGANCLQTTLQTDFSIQAIAVEAQLEALAESNLNIVSVDTVDYWWTDTILPLYYDPVPRWSEFPNIAQSVRNKPAEAIIYGWFRH